MERHTPSAISAAVVLMAAGVAQFIVPMGTLTIIGPGVLWQPRPSQPPAAADASTRGWVYVCFAPRYLDWPWAAALMFVGAVILVNSKKLYAIRRVAIIIGISSASPECFELIECARPILT